MSLEELSAMYDPETMDFDEFVRTYHKPKPSVREEQDVAYEQSLAQDREKRKQKELEKQKELQKELERQKELAVPSEICIDDPKPTLAELRLLRLAKLAPEEKKPVSAPDPATAPVPDPSPDPVPAKPDYTKLTVLELKKLCKEKGLKGFTGKCKQELINMLQ